MPRSNFDNITAIKYAQSHTKFHKTLINPCSAENGFIFLFV